MFVCEINGQHVRTARFFNQTKVEKIGTSGLHNVGSSVMKEYCVQYA